MLTFEDFLTEELPGLTRFAAVLTGNRHLAEDVLQDALVKAHTRWRRIGSLDHPVAYIRKMITTGYLSWRRRWANRTIEPAGDLGQFTNLRGARDPALTVTRADEVQRLIGTLPRRQRAAVVLRFYADCDDAEAAVAMGCSVQTVRSHISRALANLRVQVSERELDHTEV